MITTRYHKPNFVQIRSNMWPCTWNKEHRQTDRQKDTTHIRLYIYPLSDSIAEQSNGDEHRAYIPIGLRNPFYLFTLVTASE